MEEEVFMSVLTQGVALGYYGRRLQRRDEFQSLEKSLAQPSNHLS